MEHVGARKRSPRGIAWQMLSQPLSRPISAVHLTLAKIRKKIMTRLSYCSSGPQVRKEESSHTGAAYYLSGLRLVTYSDTSSLVAG